MLIHYHLVWHPCNFALHGQRGVSRYTLNSPPVLGFVEGRWIPKLIASVVGVIASRPPPLRHILNYDECKVRNTLQIPIALLQYWG